MRIRLKVISRNKTRSLDRCSVIVELKKQVDTQDRYGILFCKGDPQSMMSRLARKQPSYDLEEVKDLMRRIKSQGSKVVMYARKILNYEDFKAYKQKFMGYRFSLKQQEDEI